MSSFTLDKPIECVVISNYKTPKQRQYSENVAFVKCFPLKAK